MTFLDDSGHKTLEVGPQHVAHASESVAPPPAQRWYNGTDLPVWAQRLAAVMGLQWCAECEDFHEIAGGPSPLQRAKMPGLGGGGPGAPGGGPGTGGGSAVG